jgi:tetratricopeptide (TPR) repeat protein
MKNKSLFPNPSPQIKLALVSATLFFLTILSFPSLAEGFGDLQKLQQLGDINSPVQWFNQEELLAHPFLRQGIPDAIPIYKQIIGIAKIWWGAEHYRIARGLNFLAELYRIQGDYANAEKSLLEALRFMEKKYPNHFDTAGISNNLGRIYSIIGDYPKAEDYFLKALYIAKANNPDIATGMQNLASLYQAMGKYAKANEYYEKALNILKKKLGSEDYKTIVLRNNIAVLSMTLGNYVKAEHLFLDVLKYLNKTQRSSSLKAATLDNLAQSYYAKHHNDKTHRYKKDKDRELGNAENYYKQAIKILGGKNNPNAIRTSGNLAVLYYDRGKYKSAERTFHEAVEMCKNLPDDVIKATSLHNLGQFYHWKGEFNQAEKRYLQALKILRTRLHFEEYPVIAGIYKNLSVLYFEKGELEQANSYASEAMELEEKLFEQIFSFGTEKHWLEFQQKSYPYDLLANLTDTHKLAEAVLRNKGIVLDVLMEDQLLERAKNENSEKAKIIKDVKSIIGRLGKLWETIPQDYNKKKKSQWILAQREYLENKLEKQLKKAASILTPQEVAALTPGRRALNVKLSDVQATLSRNTVLVEFIRYEHYVNYAERQKHHSIENFSRQDVFKSRYGAVIIPANGEPKWVSLGNAESIDENIRKYQESMCDVNKDSCNTTEKELMCILQTLYTQIWKPINKELNKFQSIEKGRRNVILSPDGELNFLSFFILLMNDDEDMLGEKFDLYYVASGRDLLRETKIFNDQTILVFASPDYGTTPDFDGKKELEKLPHTKKEANQLEMLVKSEEPEWKIKKFLDSNATEEELLKHSSPHILHLATHGEFLYNSQKGLTTDFALTSNKIFSNPMCHSFLALEGAQATLDTLTKKNQCPSPKKDGILTAEEVSGLKLKGTWLVTLSACNTGRGEGRIGEGVLGMRRSFIQAGTQNLLIALSPIPDNAYKFMDDFYKKAIETENAPKALLDVQRYWRYTTVFKEEPFINAVRIFGSFIMTFQGELEEVAEHNAKIAKSPNQCHNE